MSADEITPKNHRKRNLLIKIVALVLILVLLTWVLYWLFRGRYYVGTEDAYVAGNQVMLTPQVSSGVVAIYADNTDFVQQGQLVVLLDKTNFQIALEEKKETLANTVREVAKLFENVEEKEALLEVKRAQLIQSKLNLSHRIHLRSTGAISEQEFEENKTNVDVAIAEFHFAKKDLEATKALVEGTTVETHPRVLEAVLQLKDAYLDLIRCEVIAPATGYVARRKVQVGDWAVAGETLLMIVPLDYLWVDANYKETQLSRVRIGQDVTFTADLYGKNVLYHGKVVGFTGGTGSAFALLPAQNASGNWIKIVQRLPVRISIDPQELCEHPLFIGLSTRIEIDVHDTNLPMLCKVPHSTPAYCTFSYNEQNRCLMEFNPEIEKIISENNCREYEVEEDEDAEIKAIDEKIKKENPKKVFSGCSSSYPRP